MMSKALSGAQSSANLKHGARSTGETRRVARVQKRRLLRQAGLRASDLDGLGLAYLDTWARAAAKVELLDKWAAEHGFVDEEGNLPPWHTFYLAALNSARLALGKFEDHLKVTVGPDPLDKLAAQGRQIIEARVIREDET
jgi:hypothetical protein